MLLISQVWTNVDCSWKVYGTGHFIHTSWNVVGWQTVLWDWCWFLGERTCEVKLWIHFRSKEPVSKATRSKVVVANPRLLFHFHNTLSGKLAVYLCRLFHRPTWKYHLWLSWSIAFSCTSTQFSIGKMAFSYYSSWSWIHLQEITKLHPYIPLSPFKSPPHSKNWKVHLFLQNVYESPPYIFF